MPNPERSSLSRKLMSMCLACAASALLVAYLAVGAATVVDKRQAERRELDALAAVLAQGGADAVQFNDRRLAGQLLAALAVRPNVSAAVLYDRKGQPFASWRAPARDAVGLDMPLDGVDGDALAAAGRAADATWLPRVRIYRALAAQGAGLPPAGALMIESGLVPVWLDMARALGVTAAALGIAAICAWLLARRLRRGLVDPIAKLINAAQKVSASQNYTLRIAHSRTDELGVLIDSFNNMLAQIEGRGAALTHHRDELERQVGVRTEQLERAKNAAEAASRAKSAFLATMSHEIRTPMNGVLGMTEMLLGTDLTETQRNYTRLVKQSGEHLLVIINDILDFSKIEAGKLTVEYINFNLWDLLDDIHTVYTPQAEAKGILLHFDIANDIPVAICGDPNRLRQIMANLLGNAIKFTDQGRILATVRIASEDNQAVMLRFEVHDTGIGISREARGRIFDAFSQADDSTTRKYGGTGLGLAISKQLVELMGGAIGVDTALLQGAETQGSVFWFTVAFDKRRVDPDAPGDHQHTIDGLRALVVDERTMSRVGLERHLATWRIECDGAESADEALDRLRDAARAGRPYDAAILDMELGHGGGLLLATSIKSDPAMRPTRLILLSPEKLAADPVQRRAAGVAYQLIKPARAADLFACLATPPRGQVAPAPRFLPAQPLLPHGTADAQRPRARRVLLAEDNPVNVEVAKAMLESLDLQVDCACNGAEALKAVQAAQDKQEYDVVLMDCQMPVMDGFAATAAIRRDEREAGRERVLPIIAITANALQGDRESCLAAGMDDYLSKPFSQQELAAVIGRWMALPLAATVHHEDAPPRLPPESIEVIQREAINRAALDKIRALSRERGDALVQKVIAAYVDDTPQQLRTLRDAITEVDTGNVRRIAHTLKSASANVGAETLAALCKEMEHLGRADTTEGADTLLVDMEHEFQAVRHSLTVLLEKET